MTEPAPVLFKDGGLPHAPRADVDPWVEFWDLMEAVEALCPVWPERPLSLVLDMRL